MTDMRLIVAGAGGRMGRTLVRAIAETEGVTLVGALEGPRSSFIGQDSGVLAGVGENGVLVAADVKTLATKADALIDFTTPQATVALAAMTAQAGIIHVIGTTGLKPSRRRQAAGSGEFRGYREVRQYEPRCQSARSAGQARGQDIG